MSRIYIPVGLVVILAIAGCYPAFRIDMQGLEPAAVTLSQDINTLTVVSRFDLDSLVKTEYIRNNQAKQFQRDSSIIHESIIGCSDALVESPRFNIYDPIIRRNLVGDFSNPGRPLPWPTVLAVAGDPPLDGVLSLESLQYRDTLILKASNGWVIPEQWVYIRSYWRLYNIKQQMVYDFTYSDPFVLTIDGNPDDMTSAQKSTLIKESAYQAGLATGRRLAPYWVDLERVYFPGGQKEFKKASELIREGNWEGAAEIWSRHSKSQYASIAAKACYNMAVACEMAGNISLAMEWLRQASEKGMPDLYINEYQAQLNARLSKQLLLDKQMIHNDLKK